MSNYDGPKFRAALSWRRGSQPSWILVVDTLDPLKRKDCSTFEALGLRGLKSLLDVNEVYDHHLLINK